jgi:biotin carboxyl carrier protein
VQRRNQKVIEESASPLLTEDQVRELKASAERLALAVGYRGAGTVEFLYHPGERMFAFLEVNTRLQVEHPVTELTTGMDLVKAQLHVASGGRLEGSAPVETGHAVEARLNAEDPDRDFAPAPGRIALLQLPSGPGIRVDTGVSEGDSIPAEFDSMIAKIIAYGRDRDEALARLRRALRQTTVVVEGGATNKSFLLDLLDQPEVVDAAADTGWIDRVRAEGRLVSHAHSGAALVAAAIEAYEDEEQVEVRRLLDTARGGRPQVQHKVGGVIDLKLRGATYRVTVTRMGPHRFRVGIGSGEDLQAVDADLERLDGYAGRLTVAGRRFRLVTSTHGPVHLVEVDGVTHRVSRDEGGVLRSPAPALVVATPVAVGADVEAGAPVLVLESMKMETVLHAPFPAKVRDLMVSTGSQVETAAPLVRLEPRADADEAAAAPAPAADVDLPVTEADASADERAARGLADLRGMLLGFDIDPRDDGHSLRDYLRAREELAAQGRLPLDAEIDLLGVFADFAELSRNRPLGEEEHTENRVHSPREHFHSYLQSLDVDRAGVPDAFRARLSRVLGHYGVTELDRSPELEAAVFRIFLAQQRAAPDVALATSLLRAWLVEPCPPEPLDEVAHELLDRLVLATQLRFPSVGELARSVRFRWFDQPLVDAARSEVLAGVSDEVAALAADPAAPDYAARIDALAAIPEQIVRFLAERLERGVPEREPMLEVLTRRHYREHDLRDVRPLHLGGRPFVVADYTLDDRATRLVTTVGTVAELRNTEEVVEAIAEQLAGRPSHLQGVVDLYLHWPDSPDVPEEASEQLAEVVGRLPFAADVRRIAVAVVPGAGRPVSYFTYRPEDAPEGGPGVGGVVEDELVRGIHPMVGRRLNLWRLREFHITRLDAPEDVLLYHCVARENESDQRLVALAQVRQLAVVRDADGRVTSVPHGERALMSCLEAIRRVRTERGAAGTKLDLNHVWLHVWPVVDARLEELVHLQSTLAPLTVGAGIEEVLAEGRVADDEGNVVPAALRFSYQPGAGVVASAIPPPTDLLEPLDDYAHRVMRARRRGLVYPYELVDMITRGDGTQGSPGLRR